jgi:choline kinase
VFVVKDVVISAAGVGARLGFDIPKCLVDIHGKTVIAHQLKALENIETIRVVVGFKEEDVIQEVIKYRRDAIFVRNPNFATTSNSYSLLLGSIGISDKFLSIDGDLLFTKADLEEFLISLDDRETVVVSKSSSEEAIYAHTDKVKRKIEAFSPNLKSDFEWAGIAYISRENLERNQSGFIYKFLESKLPLDYFQMDIHEIDTYQDYLRALDRFKC